MCCTLCLTVLANASAVWAQDTAPDWTLTDVYGEVHNLQETLNSGRSVLMHLQFAWDQFGWGVHSSGVVEEVHQALGVEADLLQVYLIETDPSTSESALFGGGAVTQGNWVEGVTYPVMDGGEDFMSLYDISWSPAFVLVCPNGEMTTLQYNLINTDYVLEMLENACGYGCMNYGACNFDPAALYDDASCWLAERGRDCAGHCLEDCNQDGVCDLTEDFESYNAGDSLAFYSSMWQTWSGNAGGYALEEHATVTDSASHSGQHALEINDETVGGIVDDMVFMIGESVRSHLEFSMLVPEGKSGYYNLQTGDQVGGGYGLNAFLYSDGRIAFTNETNQLVAEGHFSPGSWFRLEHEMDFELGLIDVLLDGCLVCQVPISGQQLLGIDFYGYATGGVTSTYYIDDIRYRSGGPVMQELEGGCTSPAACNYDSNVQWDDGSCCQCDALELYKTWQFSSSDGAIKVGTQPGLGDYFTSNDLPLDQADDAWTFHPTGKVDYASNGFALDPFMDYSVSAIDLLPFAFEWSNHPSGDSLHLGQVFDLASAEVRCGWMGTWDSGPDYEILELTESSLVIASRVKGEDCEPIGFEQYFTFSFEPAPTQPSMNVLACQEGCTDVLAVNYDEQVSADDGSCFYGTCNELGNPGWADLGLGWMVQFPDTLFVGEAVAVSGVIHVPTTLFDEVSGGVYAVSAWSNLTLSGLPDGLTVMGQPDEVVGGSQDCFEVAGTAESAGVFEVELVGEVYVDILGAPVLVTSASQAATLVVVAGEGGTPGCTYPSATNFDELAMEDDGSCTWEASSCPEDVNADGMVTISDLLQLLAVFGNGCQ